MIIHKIHVLLLLLLCVELVRLVCMIIVNAITKRLACMINTSRLKLNYVIVVLYVCNLCMQDKINSSLEIN